MCAGKWLSFQGEHATHQNGKSLKLLPDGIRHIITVEVCETR